MSVNPITPALFQGGQMTDLPVFSGSLNGTEVMEIVAAPTGQTNAQAGVNYQINTNQLAVLLVALGQGQVIIKNGQFNSPANPYIPTQFVGRIYVNKTVAEPTYIAFNPAVSYSVEPIVQDVAGTLNGTTAVITCTFSGGELANGLATIPIGTPYGGYVFRPVPSIPAWILGTP